MAWRREQPSASNRLTERLLAYWETLRAARLYPSEAEVDPDALGALWDSCFLVRLGDASAAPSYKYTYLGLSLIEAYGDDLAHEGLREALVDPASGVLAPHFEEVRRTSRPVLHDGEFTNRRGMLVKYRSVLLPLGTSDGGVQYVLGGMKWRFY